MVRYYIHAVDGQKYGPVELDTVNQWIAEGRVVPTTLLQPENSAMQVAASTIDGLTWGQGQTFDSYSPQTLSNAHYEFVGAWACLGASFVLCCLPPGAHISLGIGGMVLSVLAYRKGKTLALLALILNLLLAVVAVVAMRTTGAFNPMEFMRHLRDAQGQ